MSDAALPIHPAATAHLPGFITAPGETDAMMVNVGIFLVLILLTAGALYFRLHALPEHMAHRANKVQLQLVGALALLSLFTHNHIFWIAGLLLALIDLPDISRPFASIAASLERIAGRDRGAEAADAFAPAPPDGPPAAPPARDHREEKTDA